MIIMIIMIIMIMIIIIVSQAGEDSSLPEFLVVVFSPPCR